MPYELTQPVAKSTAPAWRHKTKVDRQEWFDEHGDAIARARGSFVQALDYYAAEIAKRGAAERPQFLTATFANDVLDVADAALSEEVRSWLGAD